MKPNKILLLFTFFLILLFSFVAYLTIWGEVGMELNSTMSHAKVVMKEMRTYHESLPAVEYSQAKREYI